MFEMFTFVLLFVAIISSLDKSENVYTRKESANK